jgi:hypothetical protein
METAFQPDAFQNDAFQIAAPAPRGGSGMPVVWRRPRVEPLEAPKLEDDEAVIVWFFEEMM